jgi:hypothetical protein
MTSSEREKLWRSSELYHEIQVQASNLQLREEKAEKWKRLAGQLDISFPFNKDLEVAYENNCLNDELENVD